MTNFILHIGDGKCGSTAIQNSLYASRAHLADAGIHYDTLAPNSGHTVLALLAGQRSRAASPAREAVAARTLQLLQDECQRYEWVVLSAENFINLSPEAAINLVSRVSSEIGLIHVVAYVRNPSEMYASSVQQLLKGSHLFPAPETYHRRVDQKLKAWKDRVGQDRLHVRQFSRKFLPRGDVVTDFSQILGTIVGTEISLSPASSNRSLSAEQTRVLQMFRKAVYPNDAGSLLPRSTELVRFFTALNEIKLVGNQISLSGLAREVVASRNADVARGLMDCFPELDLLEACEGRLPVPTGPFPWTDNDSVESILAVCDRELVEHIAAILPELNGENCADGHIIVTAMDRLGFHTDSERQAFLGAHEAYQKARLRCRR